MIYGLDQLGAARYKKVAIQEHPRAWAFGAFLEVSGFGTTYDVFDTLAKEGVPVLRVQMMWKDDHKFTTKDLPEIEKRAKKLAPIMAKYPLTVWYISPCCENELNAAQFELFAQAVRKHIPAADIVNSPNYNKGHVSNKYVNEYHHGKNRGGARVAFSFDGDNCVDSDVETYKKMYSNAEYFMFWAPQCNGNRKVFKPGDKRGPKDYVDRAKRIYWPTPKQIDSWVWLGTHTRGDSKIPLRGLYKSHGDQHTVPPSGKDQKPVWILKERYPEIVVKAQNGQVIDTAKYFGPFEGGGYRYYHTQWGFDLAEKAIRIQGHSLCNVFARGKLIGRIDCAFRFGSFR